MYGSLWKYFFEQKKFNNLSDCRRTRFFLNHAMTFLRWHLGKRAEKIRLVFYGIEKKNSCAFNDLSCFVSQNLYEDQANRNLRFRSSKNTSKRNFLINKTRNNQIGFPFLKSSKVIFIKMMDESKSSVGVRWQGISIYQFRATRRKIDSLSRTRERLTSFHLRPRYLTISFTFWDKRVCTA